MDNFIFKHSKSLVFFVFFVIGFVFLLILNYDYVRYDTIKNLNVSDLNIINGNVDKTRWHKTKFTIYINDTEYVINENLEVNKDDYVTIYYYEKDGFRNNEIDIIQISIDNNCLYSYDDYVNDNNPTTYFYILLVILFVDITLLILGFVMLKFPYDNMQLTANVIKNLAKDTNISSEEIMNIIKNYKTESLDIDEEELKKIFKNSIYKKNNKFYTTAMEHILNSLYNNVFNEVLFEILDDKEFRIIYDDCLVDNSACFVVFKYNNKLVSIYMFNEEDGKFLIDKTCLYFIYPKEVKMNKQEKCEFYSVIKEYMLYNDDIKVNWK